MKYFRAKTASYNGLNMTGNNLHIIINLHNNIIELDTHQINALSIVFKNCETCYLYHEYKI